MQSDPALVHPFDHLLLATPSSSGLSVSLMLTIVNILQATHEGIPFDDFMRLAEQPGAVCSPEAMVKFVAELLECGACHYRVVDRACGTRKVVFVEWFSNTCWTLVKEWIMAGNGPPASSGGFGFGLVDKHGYTLEDAIRDDSTAPGYEPRDESEEPFIDLLDLDE